MPTSAAREADHGDLFDVKNQFFFAHFWVRSVTIVGPILGSLLVTKARTVPRPRFGADWSKLTFKPPPADHLGHRNVYQRSLSISIAEVLLFFSSSR
jgi:hypothetical protein